MPIAASDLKTKFSIKTGTAGNQNPQTDPNASLGKYISTTEWLGGVLHDLFDKVTGDENAALNAEYRCIFFHNAHGTLQLDALTVWLSAETPGGANIAIGVDPAAASPIGQATAQAAEVANEDTAPAGVTFTSPTTKPTGVVMGNIPVGQCRALWLRRTPLNTGALANDSVTLTFEGDSPP